MKSRVPGFSYDPRRKRATFRVLVPGSDRRRKKTVSAETRDEAFSKWKTFREQIRNGLPTENLTFGAYVEERWPHLKQGLAEGTAENYEHFIDAFLLPFFRDRRLERINGALARDFIAWMERKEFAPGKTYSADYVRMVWRVMAMLLHAAVDAEIIAAYPVRGKVKLPKAARLRLELSPQEQAALLRAFDDEAGFRKAFASEWKPGKVVESAHFGAPRRFGGRGQVDGIAAGIYFRAFQRMKPFFIGALHTGLDLGDLRLLERSAVKWDEGFIRVQRGKSKEEALIPISETLREALRAAQAEAVRSGRYVFATAEGKPYSVAKVSRAWERAKLLAGITRRCRFKDLRHTFGSNLAARGISLQMIAKAMGHKSTRTTEIYSRPSDESLRGIAAALDGALPEKTVPFTVPSTQGSLAASRKPLKSLERATGFEPATFSLGS